MFLLNRVDQRAGTFLETTAGPPASIEVKPGETLRLRLINGSTTYAFRLQIDGHRLTVIASDGAPLQPVDVDNLVINIGERYDVLLKANGSDVVWIRAATLAGDEALAVLRYPNSAAEPEPSPVKWGEQMLTPEQMKSLKPVVLADNPQVVPLQLGGTRCLRTRGASMTRCIPRPIRSCCRRTCPCDL